MTRVTRVGKGRDMLGEYGILSSINPWATLNHCDRGRDRRGVWRDCACYTAKQVAT